MRKSLSRGSLDACLAAAMLALASPSFAQADDTSAMRVQISLRDRRLWVIERGGDTLFTAPVAVGSGRTLKGDRRTWRFVTPTGVTTVVAREENPVWVPPDWHYVELAKARGLRLERLTRSDTVKLSGGRRLLVRGETAGILAQDTLFVELLEDEEIVFDRTLFIPPFGTRQRLVKGVLGPYRLVLANGVGLHGTPFKDSIGKAVTHGCIRLLDEDITWLYEHVGLGTPVVIYKDNPQ